MHYSTTSVRRRLFKCLTSVKLLNRIWRNLTGRMAVYQVNVFFSGRSGKQDGRTDLLLAETFSSPLKLPKGISWWNERKQYLNILDKFVFGGWKENKNKPPRPLIGWDIFDFVSHTAEQNLMTQELIVLYQVCSCRTDQKYKMTALASNWLIHFKLSLWNYLTGI